MSKVFHDLIEVSNRLNDPKTGCPWDIKQTFQSLQKYILEEACELVDAVDEHNIPEMIEELGDLFYVVVFYSKVAERDKLFTLDQVLEILKEKLIRRHPHIFGDISISTSEEVEKKWLEIKKEEKKERTSVLDGIPRSLASLARAQKILSRLFMHAEEDIAQLIPKASKDEKTIAHEMLELVVLAEKQGLDAEKILRKAVNAYEEAFREKEKKQKD